MINVFFQKEEYKCILLKLVEWTKYLVWYMLSKSWVSKSNYVQFYSLCCGLHSIMRLSKLKVDLHLSPPPRGNNVGIINILVQLEWIFSINIPCANVPVHHKISHFGKCEFWQEICFFMCSAFLLHVPIILAPHTLFATF